MPCPLPLLSTMFFAQAHRFKNYKTKLLTTIILIHLPFDGQLFKNASLCEMF
jgi:hypothetical protein